ncbi:hypothetical protein GCM10010299_30040 [Streptomyces tanashiensis]|nr:hypothetical protein GCM10010299_30040 [Streptomyces tanashiensis]
MGRTWTPVGEAVRGRRGATPTEKEGSRSEGRGPPVRGLGPPPPRARLRPSEGSARPSEGSARPLTEKGRKPCCGFRPLPVFGS